MKKWHITYLENGKTREVFVRRNYKDGIPLTKDEVLKEYILPHVKFSKAKIDILTVEEM